MLRQEIENSRQHGDEEMFEDRLHHFVQTMKKLTYVQEVNIFSKEHVQIYTDMESQNELRCTDQQRDSVMNKIKEFNEVQAEQKFYFKNNKYSKNAVYKKYLPPSFADLLELDSASINHE